MQELKLAVRLMKDCCAFLGGCQHQRKALMQELKKEQKSDWMHEQGCGQEDCDSARCTVLLAAPLYLHFSA